MGIRKWVWFGVGRGDGWGGYIGSRLFGVFGDFFEGVVFLDFGFCFFLEDSVG